MLSLHRLLLLLLAATLAGCGGAMRVAYNNGDVAVRLLAHEYFDLHGDQTDAFKLQLARFHTWHRTEELPRYADIFHGAARRVEKGLAREDVVWAIGSVRERTRALTAQAIDEAAPVIVMLGPDNVIQLQKKLVSSNDKFAKEYLSGDERRNEHARAKRLRNRLEEWIGDLTAEQEALVEAYAHSMPRVAAVALEDRKRRQRELFEILSEYRGKPELVNKVRAFAVGWEAQRSAEYVQLARQQEEGFIDLMVALDRTLTSRQRAHAVHRLENFAREFRVLHAEGAPRSEPVRAANLHPAGT